MRVLMLSPDAQMIDRRILQEARTLHDAGHEVTLLSGFECRQPDAYVQDGIRIKRYTYDWTDPRRSDFVARLGRSAGSALWPAMRVYARVSGALTAFETYVLKKICEHAFDVLHVHDLPLLQAGMHAAARVGAKLVYDAHEFYPMQSVLTKAQRDRYLKIERRLMAKCAATITVNPYIADMMARTYAIPAPAVLLNAMPTPAAERLEQRAQSTGDAAVRAAERRAKRLPENDFLILYQGWLSAERNLETLVEAMVRQPPGRTLVIVGYGDHLEVLKALAEERGVADRILFYGRVESDDLQEITVLCDAGIIPYTAIDEMHRYCSPNKLYEFIMAGLPIIASDLPYLRDVIAGYGVGWLGDCSTADGVAALMNTAAASGRPAEKLLAARGELNWEKEAQKLLAIYARI